MLRARSLLALCGLVALCLPACQTKPIDSVGTAVAPGDTLWGRLPPGRTEQGFTFEGVERSVVTFKVRSDDPDEAAPIVTLFDPQGKQIDIAPDTVSKPGAATVEVQAVPLLRNGTYRVVAVPATPDRSVWYSFSHELEIPQGDPERISVNGMDPTPVHISAPRGALIAFRVEPADGHRVVPELRGVQDPSGGRALDKTQTPRGALPPRISDLGNGGFVLTFTAPRTGRYTMLPAAKGEGRGVVVTSAKLRLPARTQRHVAHSNSAAPGGVGRATASATRSRTPQDRLRPMPRLPQATTPQATLPVDRAPAMPAPPPMAPPTLAVPRASTLPAAIPPAAIPPAAIPPAPMAPPAEQVPPLTPSMRAPMIRTPPAPGAPGKPAFPHYPAPPIDPPPMAAPTPAPAAGNGDPLLGPGVAGVRGRPLPQLPPLPPSGPPTRTPGR